MEEKQTTSAGTAAETSALQDRLAALEQLLEDQRAESRKQSKYRRLTAALLLCLVLVFGIGLFSLNNTLQAATQGIPQLLTTTTEAVDSTSRELQKILSSIEEVDFVALNSAIQEIDTGVSQMDFDALNSSIEDLQLAAEGLANLTAIFR